MRPDSSNLLALSEQLGAALKARGWKLVTAESCTGGWIAQAVTAVAGSSEWFDRGYVTYSNTAKRDELGVSESTLRSFGAVSEQTVAEMALGALVRSGCDIAVSVSGIAGPGGGSPQKPVGTVCFAWALRGDNRPQLATRVFAGDRTSVREQSVALALQTLLGLSAQSP
jgi:nicotinamide-nucleotide amidase